MAIEYAGGTRVNYTFTDAGTRADLVSKLETQLTAAGWSTISGGGTGDVLMKSAVTPQGLSIRLRLYDPGSGNCAQFTMKNNAGTLTSQIQYLLPGSVQWRIVANKYWFGMFKTGPTYRRTARAILFCGTIWVPDFVLTVMAGDLDCGFITGGGDSDTSTTARTSWRSQPGGQGDSHWASTLWKSNLVNYSGTANNSNPNLMLPAVPGGATNTGSFEWEGTTRHAIEAIIGWTPDSAATTRNKIKGQLFDGLLLGGQFDGEGSITFDAHTFIVITDLADYSALQGTGTLCVAVD